MATIHHDYLMLETLHETIWGEKSDTSWMLYQQPEPPRWPEGDPSPEAKALRLSLEWDLKAFAERFFPDLCRVQFSAMHYEFFRRHDERKVPTGKPDRPYEPLRGWRDATAAPRGNAKTTIKGKIEIIHNILYLHERYIGVCSANHDLAKDKVKDIRDTLAEHPELIRIYGPMETREWKQDDFVTKNQVRVRAFTPRSKIRGFNWKGLRPTKLLLDDAEDPESMLTELRRQRFSQWFKSDVSKLGDGRTNFDIIGTILHPQSLLSELLQNPGFQSSLYQAVIAFAEGQEAWELWRQWRDIVVDLSNPHRLHAARDFYLAHEQDMLAGAEVLWPSNETYYDLMLTRIIDGETAFWTEKMNEPLSDERYIFDMDDAAYCRLLPEGILRADGTMIPFVTIHEIAAYYDPTPPKKEAVGHDYACCVIVMKDVHGYIYCVDCYLDQEISTERQIEAVVDLLWKWKVALFGVESNGFQSLLGQSIKEAIAKRAQEEGVPWTVDIIPVVNTRNKMLRIRSLEPMVSNHWVQFSTNLPNEAYRQMAEFLPIDGASFDDYPDALEGSIRTIRGLWDRRAYS